ncbi:hypothetical protein BMR1_02g02095 [Babesia microti strain RI]|uniref:RING-type domain-containing protein n=1 Tax=Babesia microti (strain RI) TaxID=1133968 RepID=I7J687_BABMR|nr:hypothetical protein BMR1_02g02095 [Babesia microti strain RI]CCF73577.1 hypothetical protein BMR1_02g02095 [Babesia microti strain RI]|eukprot:XP_012648186.1 hypothetical protein BMR1_02g02095 [Babesia microti strain RI]
MGSIYYRFGSERGIWRELNIDVDLTAGLLVSDLKILVAEETNLSHEFARRTDLSLSLYDSNGNTTQLGDNCLVHPGERIVVNRIAWTRAPNIVHEASKQLSAIEIALPSPTLENVLPDSLICTLCQQTMKKPVLVKCTFACGASGCKKCVLRIMDKNVQHEGVQDGVDTSAYNNNKCPFCKKGHVTAITINRRLQSLLQSLDANKNDITDCKDHVDNGDQLKIDQSNADNIVNDADHQNDSEMDEDDNLHLPTFSYPSHYVYLLSNELFNLVRSSGYTFISEGQSSWLGVYLDAEGDSSEAKIIPISLVGGGTSYVIGGVFKLGTKCKVQLQYDEAAKEFLEQAIKLGIDTNGLAVYRSNWINKFLDTPMVPIRKQPFVTFISNNTFKGNNGILSSKKLLFNECTEIAIDEHTFNLVVAAVNTHNPMASKLSVKNVMKDTVKRKVKRLNWRDACYPGGPNPLPMHLGDTNPYAGYCHLLPFLSESQFQLLKKAQELLKINFLKSFKKNVIKSLKMGKISKKVAGKLLCKMYDNMNNIVVTDVNV